MPRDDDKRQALHDARYTQQLGDHDITDEEIKKRAAGTLKPHAASILMKILYMARMARYDLLKATCKLATHITRWDALCDKRLKRLVEYLDSTRSYRLMGWIGDRVNEIIPCLWTDADLAGCPKT